MMYYSMRMRYTRIRSGGLPGAPAGDAGRAVAIEPLPSMPESKFTPLPGSLPRQVHRRFNGVPGAVRIVWSLLKKSQSSQGQSRSVKVSQGKSNPKIIFLKPALKNQNFPMGRVKGIEPSSRLRGPSSDLILGFIGAR